MRLPGVEAAFATDAPKDGVIGDATNRFGGSAGEVHIYSDDAATIERTIVIEGRGQHTQVGGD